MVWRSKKSEVIKMSREARILEGNLVTGVSTFDKIIKTVALSIFQRGFAKHLKKRIREVAGTSVATEIFDAMLHGLTIVNPETFLGRCRIGGTDIGKEAWTHNSENVMEFAARAVYLMSVCRGREESCIDLSSIIVYLASFYSSKSGTSSASSMEQAIRLIFSSAICASSNPFYIRVLHTGFLEGMFNKLGVKGESCYRTVVQCIIDYFNEIWEEDIVLENKKSLSSSITFPHIEFMVPVIQETRTSQLNYLAHIFRMDLAAVRRATSDIASLSEDSSELRVALAELKQKHYYQNMDDDTVISELKSIESEDRLLSYPSTRVFHEHFCSRVYGRGYSDTNKKYSITDRFMEYSTFLKDPYNTLYEVTIECGKFEHFEDVEPLAHAAAKLFSLRVQPQDGIGSILARRKMNSHLLLTIKNVPFYTVPFIDYVKELEQKLRSTYNQNFVINIEYKSEAARSHFSEAPSNYIRVISDIHTDVNKDRHYLFNFGNDFVINCGDTSGNVLETREWIRANMKKGVVVAGNHMGYSNVTDAPNTKDPELTHPNNTMNIQILNFKRNARKASVRTLANDIYETDEFICIGNTLYTDFKLYGEKNQAACMMEAAHCMNDFRIVQYLTMDFDRDGWKVVPFNVDIYVSLHKKCKGYIIRMLKKLRERNNKKPIIIVTHHTPLPFCISEKYKNDPLSAAFASDLRNLIDTYPEIRLWCSGHVHEPYDFLYNETRFVCEPWGYFNENNFDIKTYGKRISINDLTAPHGWRYLLAEEIKKGKVKDYGYSELFKGLEPYKPLNRLKDKEMRAIVEASNLKL